MLVPDDQLEQHRTAWRAVVEGIPGSEFISHEVELNGGDWERSEVHVPVDFPVTWREGHPKCRTCGEYVGVVGLTTKCRDWHEVCQCGERYDQPKAKGCRRRKHPKPEEGK